ncbi:helix-turn-helix transcriptional regulator [Argonema antarcticum]|uniref:helix-turn-helix transcriptional regulator n=1 Tax=Argonema antarcticum TaxID=2942763 RepID=UPI002011E30B|nr:LuxR C-terminal-related transcriptional regulator [Argonema antarcticum]MCL1469890.1 LuxR C-terminal-related transcriptional regulator [Argonema antarcticum A004/B2]
MANLQSLFQTVTQAKDEQELRSHIYAEVREYFAAKRSGLFFFDAPYSTIPDQAPQRWRDRNLQNLVQLALSTEYNPILRYLVERHAPAHEALVGSPKAWQLICPRADHWHVMAGPIVNQGQLVGAVGFTRVQGMPSFDPQNLMDLSALCLHLSTWVATVRSSQQMFKTNRLTSRELQIASLVAQGRTNAEIGVELWITENSVKQALKRMFRKLEVSSRTQMVTQLSANTKLFSASSKPG